MGLEALCAQAGKELCVVTLTAAYDVGDTIGGQKVVHPDARGEGRARPTGAREFPQGTVIPVIGVSCSESSACTSTPEVGLLIQKNPT